MSDEIIPAKESEMFAQNPSLSITKDDIIAIQITELENRLHIYETELNAKIATAHTKVTSLDKKINQILTNDAKEKFKQKSDALIKALSEFLESGKNNFSCNVRADLKHDKENVREYAIPYMVSASCTVRCEERDKHREWQTAETTKTMSFLAPKEITSLVQERKALNQEIEKNNEELQKTRLSMSRMPYLERQAKAALAKHHLKSLGQEKVLDSLKNMAIPGLPGSIQRLLTSK